MLFLVFHVGGDGFALEASQVSEIVPFVDVRPLPQAPRGVAGVVNFRGAPVPVVDLSILTLGRPAERRLSTRLVLLRYPADSGETHTLGLIVEKATRTLRREAADFAPSGVTCDGLPYLGPVATDDEGGLVQHVDVRTLLPAAVRTALFQQVLDQPCP